MKITKRQLRRIIREMHPRASVDDAIFDYEEWARERGSPLGASSVMASYIIERGIEDNHDTHQALALQFGLQHEDVMRELRMQQEERSINMGESKMKIAKRQLRRMIREEKKRILRETPRNPRYMDSSEEKTAARLASNEANSTIDSLQMLLDLNYHRFTDEESSILDQALDILNDKLYKR